MPLKLSLRQVVHPFGFPLHLNHPFGNEDAAFLQEALAFALPEALAFVLGFFWAIISEQAEGLFIFLFAFLSWSVAKLASSKLSRVRASLSFSLSISWSPSIKGATSFLAVTKGSTSPFQK